MKTLKEKVGVIQASGITLSALSSALNVQYRTAQRWAGSDDVDASGPAALIINAMVRLFTEEGLTPKELRRRVDFFRARLHPCGLETILVDLVRELA